MKVRTEGTRGREADPATCMRCRALLPRGNRVLEVYTVEAVVGSELIVSPYLLYLHRDCPDPALKIVPIDASALVEPASRQQLTDMKDIDPLTPENICRLCRRAFQRGDRVVIVHLVVGRGIDPETKREAAAISPNFEVAHFACGDRALGADGPTLVLASGQ